MENDGKLAEAWWSRVWQTMKLPRGFEELEVLTNFETARFAGNLKPGSGENTQAVGVTIIRVSRNGKPENHYQCNWELQRKLGLRMESCDDLVTVNCGTKQLENNPGPPESRF
jgi:hypothetical protein